MKVTLALLKTINIKGPIQVHRCLVTNMCFYQFTCFNNMSTKDLSSGTWFLTVHNPKIEDSFFLTSFLNQHFDKDLGLYLKRLYKLYL